MMPNYINIGHLPNAARTNFLQANAKAFVGYIQATLKGRPYHKKEQTITFRIF
jgi:hypothetical protein